MSFPLPFSRSVDVVLIKVMIRKLYCLHTVKLRYSFLETQPHRDFWCSGSSDLSPLCSVVSLCLRGRSCVVGVSPEAGIT